MTVVLPPPKVDDCSGFLEISRIVRTPGPAVKPRRFGVTLAEDPPPFTVTGKSKNGAAAMDPVFTWPDTKTPTSTLAACKSIPADLETTLGTEERG